LYSTTRTLDRFGNPTKEILMNSYELTADPIVIENIRAGDVDGFARKGQWYYNPATACAATKSGADSHETELAQYLSSSERIWLKNPIGRLQYFGWMWLISVSERVLTKTFDTPLGTTTGGWTLMMLVLLGLFVSSFVIIRKREIDITRSFAMTWRAWLYIAGWILAFGIGFFGATVDPLSPGVSEAQANALHILVFLPAHLSLLFQSGHLSAEAKRRRKLRRNG
jgi:hypothetical protein